MVHFEGQMEKSMQAEYSDKRTKNQSDVHNARAVVDHVRILPDVLFVEGQTRSSGRQDAAVSQEMGLPF
jgi:hypothetical protein